MKFFYEKRPVPLQIHYGRDLSYDAHMHDHIELVGMLKGEAAAFVDSREYRLQEGDVVIVFPNQIHRYEKVEEEYYMIFIFQPDLTEEFSQVFQRMVPEDALIKGGMGDRKLKQAMENIMELAQKETDMFSGAEMKGNFLILLGRLLARMRLQGTSAADTQTLRQILNYCVEHVEDDLRLEAVSAGLHISGSYISHLFVEKLHMTFGEYVRTLRVSRACRLLQDGRRTVTEAAYEAGFNSLRSFDRAFAKQMKMTPVEYKRKLADGRDKGMGMTDPIRSDFARMNFTKEIK